MKPADRLSREKEIDRSYGSMALITLIVFLIITFVASCVYIGINGFLSR